MDASNFDFTDDAPLPRTCQHCKWSRVNVVAEMWGAKGLLACINPLQVWGRQPTPDEDAWKAQKGVAITDTCKHWEELPHKQVGASDTCDHWEERE